MEQNDLLLLQKYDYHCIPIISCVCIRGKCSYLQPLLKLSLEHLNGGGRDEAAKVREEETNQ